MARETRSGSLVVAVAVLALPAAALGTLGEGLGWVHENAAFYAAWNMDADRNGLDDALDAALARGEAGTVLLEAHYGHRPGAREALELQARGALRTWVLDNWDDVVIEADLSAAPALRAAPGVVALELLPTWRPLDMNVAAHAARVRQALGEPIVGGVDHSLAVHETLGLRGEGMVIAIIDTGIDNLHESIDDLDDNPLTDDPKLLQRTDPATGLPVYAAADVSVPGQLLGCVNPIDDHGHGSHVAGIAAGTGGLGGLYVGVAPKARIVEVDIDSPPGGSAFVANMILAFDWVINFNKGSTCYGPPGADRIDVASMSFTSSSNPQASLSKKITDIARSGITFTLSAGNAGPGQGTLSGGAEGAILVGSTYDFNTVVRDDDYASCFSSRGPRPADGDADALDELRPDITTFGAAVISVRAHTYNGYVAFSGTSMSAPHAAGVAALMLQADPGLDPVDMGSNDAMGDAGAVPIRDLMQQSAHYNTFTSAGCATPPQTFATGKFGLPWNNAWSYGQLDAYDAVQAALAP